MMINFEYETNIKLDVPYEDIITKSINGVLEFEDCPYEIEINVILTDNEEIRQINLDYRDLNEPTDVLSFPMVDYDIASDFSKAEKTPEHYFNPDTGELMLGDIIISVEKVIEQANSYGHSLERELAFLTVHSVLHLFGYDHMDKDEREHMETKQESILDLLSFYR